MEFWRIVHIHSVNVTNNNSKKKLHDDSIGIHNTGGGVKEKKYICQKLFADFRIFSILLIDWNIYRYRENIF